MTKGKIVAVNGEHVREVIRKGGNWAAPGTVGEQATDTAYAAEHRELIARQRFLERRISVGYSRFHSVEIARDRAEQLSISRELDADEAELAAVRGALAAYGPRANAATDRGVVKDDRARGRDALNTIMHMPSLKKSDLPDIFDLDNSMGVRSQPEIKE